MSLIDKLPGKNGNPLVIRQLCHDDYILKHIVPHWDLREVNYRMPGNRWNYKPSGIKEKEL